MNAGGILRMVKSLITGIGGFVASHLAEYLLDKGEEVHGTCRWNEDLARLKGLRTRAKLHALDLNDMSACMTVLKKTKPDYIFHLGAQSYVSESFDYPAATLQTNVIGTLNLLEAVRLIRDDDPSFDPVIHVCSTSEVYGLVGEEDIPIKETTRFNPSNPYAVGKVGTDMLALMYWTNYKIKTIRTRMFTHTGPGRTMMSAECAFARQIAIMEKKRSNSSINQEDLILKHGNLNSVRTWADVRDAVRAYYLLVRECEPGEVYNIGGNVQHTIGEMLDYLISLSPLEENIKKEVNPKLLRPYDVTLQIPDISKFQKATNWKPTYTFEDTMKDLLNWWREYV